MNDNKPHTAAPATAFSNQAERLWHAMPPADAVTALSTHVTGLTQAEVATRMARFGPNALPSEEKRSLLRRLIAQLDNMLIYVLLGSAIITASLGHLTDTAVILTVVVINAVFGIVQEGRAERALDAIKAMISPNASVIREGGRTTIPAVELVPGDILLIEAGDRVTADARLISARGLRVDESALTGESVPADKRPQADSPDAALAERASMIYSGTLITQGQGQAVVVATGRHTELGRITTLMGTLPDKETPLIRQVNAFARQLSFAILALSAATFLFAYFVRRYSLDDAFLAVVGMAVAAIPEGLPAVMTITLAIGVERMSRRHAIIRHLPAVETLGSVSVICTDKTGTLTRNEMTAHHVATASGVYAIDGTGYDPAGSITRTACADAVADGTEDRAFEALWRIAALCNDSILHHDQDRGWCVQGDPMEGALLVLAMKARADVDALKRAMPRLDVIPFDAGHRFMATVHGGGERPKLYLKGAPEAVLALCSHQLTCAGSEPIDARMWQRHIDAFASQGERTLAFATADLPPGVADIDVGDVNGGLTMAGIVGLIDPPREEARRAIIEAQAAGVTTKMITGDHALTAAAIARQLGLANPDQVATGADIEHLGDEALNETARRVSVFARAAPEHKLRLVAALRRDGAIIAMTGDGVNDAPALRSADVGIAMGKKGTEVAKEASQMVLADDNFASIVAAVKEGRTVYDNLTKVIAWTLPTSFGETLVVMMAILGGFILPVTPVQILWINMVTAVALGLVLAFEPAEADVMRRAPRKPDQSLLTGFLVYQVALVSILFVLGAFSMFWWARHRNLPIEEARTIVVNTIVVFEIFYLFAVRYLRGGAITWEGIKGTPAVLIGVATIVVFQLAFTYLPFMQLLFDTRAIAAADGAAIIGAGIALLIILEVEKHARRRFAHKLPSSGA